MSSGKDHARRIGYTKRLYLLSAMCTRKDSRLSGSNHISLISTCTVCSTRINRRIGVSPSSPHTRVPHTRRWALYDQFFNFCFPRSHYVLERVTDFMTIGSLGSIVDATSEVNSTFTLERGRGNITKVWGNISQKGPCTLATRLGSKTSSITRPACLVFLGE